MDSKQKMVSMETQDGTKVEDVEAPVTKDGRDDRLPKSEHFPSVRVKTEVVVDTEIKDGRSSDSQREIEMLKGALKQRDEELRAVTRLYLNQLYPGDVSKRRKYDRLVELTEKRVKIDGLEKSGNQEAGSWCVNCKTSHSGLCTSRTRRCHKCGEIGHVTASCKSPPLCFVCREMGHISSECTMKKVTGHVGYTVGKAGYEKGESSGNKDEGKHISWCMVCRTRHHGPCTLDTVRCRNCGKIGHWHAKCMSDPICYNCEGTGHCSRDCPKEKVKASRICYSCRKTGHISRDCPKKKSG